MEADFIARLREFYRVRDPNVGSIAGDLINSINDLLRILIKNIELSCENEG